jgi:hypothetical protein
VLNRFGFQSVGEAGAEDFLVLRHTY